MMLDPDDGLFQGPLRSFYEYKEPACTSAGDEAWLPCREAIRTCKELTCQRVL